MSREQLLILYCLSLGGGGWACLFLTPQPETPLVILALFGLLALVVDFFSFRTPPTDPHSLGGLVLITAALVLGPAPAALIAAVEGLIVAFLFPFRFGRPRTFYTLIARPILRSGGFALGILGGAALALSLPLEPAPMHTLATPDAPIPAVEHVLIVLICLIAGYMTTLLVGRIGLELIQGGRTGVQTWWRSTWRQMTLIELLPLPLAALGAAIYQQLGLGYFLLAGIALSGVSLAVRRAALNLNTQRRSVRELALLNEVSRAIIRSELDADALCDLIYREASKIVDTSSFHLGLFDGDSYTLQVRVQDRVRLPPLTVKLAVGDGIMGWIRQTGRSLLVDDFNTEMARLPARPRYQSERPPRSGIYVPLIAGETVIGSISVQSYQPRAFDANDLRLLSLIADQAAVAIARARAFHDANQRALQLQAIHEVSERVTAILNLEELLPSVVRLIRERFQYHPVHIFTLEPGSERIIFRASTSPPERLPQLQAAQTRLGEGIVGHAAASGQPVLVGDVGNDVRYIPDNSSTRSELAVPLRIGEQVIGVLDVQSEQNDDFDADDLFVMRTLADQIAIAIDSANSYTAQQEEAWTLNALLQVADNVGRATTLEELLPTIVRLPPLLLGCERCGCMLWERSSEQFRIVAYYGLPQRKRDALIGLALHIDETPLLAEMRDELHPMQLQDAQAHAALCPPLVEQCGSGTLILLPILARASLLGVLLLDYDNPNQLIGPRQMALATGAINQIAAALESALLAQDAAEAARLEQELRVAREIQTDLLPAAMPRIPGWEIVADWRSARLVGGDFYDFWFLQPRVVHGEQERGEMAGHPLAVLHPPSQVLGFVIADVSDKGVPAALFMALSRSLVRAAALDGSPPGLALQRANRWIARDTESGMFVTLFYALLETDSGHLRYTCAGHNPPLLYHAALGTFEELATPGIALGVLEEVRLNEAVAVMEPGDLLVCYTDGVTEAINEDEEEFGTARLRALIAQHYAAGAEAVLHAITSTVARFTNGQTFDDITLVVVKRAP